MALGKPFVIASEVLLDKAAVEQWHESQGVAPPNPVRGLLQAAATDPLGLHILARRMVYQESFAEAIEHLGAVTERKILPGAARMRVQRIKRSLLDTLS